MHKQLGTVFCLSISMRIRVVQKTSSRTVVPLNLHQSQEWVDDTNKTSRRRYVFTQGIKEKRNSIYDNIKRNKREVQPQRNGNLKIGMNSRTNSDKLEKN